MSKKKIDKRTKAYKESVKKSEGLGDTIEKITKATGIKKAVELFNKLTGQDCNCDKRQEYLNKEYRYKANCMVLSEFNWWTDYLKRHNENNYTKNDVIEILRLYRRLFKKQLNPCMNCKSGLRVMKIAYRDINVVYSSYKQND